MLQVTESKTALSGRTVLRLASSRRPGDVPSTQTSSSSRTAGDAGAAAAAVHVDSSVARLPATKLRSGDVVGLSVITGGVERVVAEGVVLQLRTDWVSVALSDPPDDSLGGGGLVITRRANDITHKRLLATLDELSTRHKDAGGSTDFSPVTRALFAGEGPGRAPRSYSPPPQQPALDQTAVAALTSAVESNSGATDAQLISSREDGGRGLNASQERAVTHALGRAPVAVIHGPPGTGKTTTVVELIRRLAVRGERVLAAAPSNIAVDNLVERLVAAGVRVVRIGHPARIMPGPAQQCSLDALVDASDEAALVRDIRKEMNDITKKLARKQSKSGGGKRGGGGGSDAKGGGGGHDATRQLRAEFKSLKKELRRREAVSILEVLRGADVVVGTLAGLTPHGPVGKLPEGHFDVAVRVTSPPPYFCRWRCLCVLYLCCNVWCFL